MKKLFLIAAVALMAVACGGNKGFTINGNIEGLEGPVKLTLNGDTIAETETTDGKFILEGEIEGPNIYYLAGDQRPFAILFLDKGDKLDITGKMEERRADVTIKGSVANENFKKYSEWEDELYGRYQAADQEGRSAILEERTTYIAETTDKNADNLFGIYMLANNSYELEPEVIIEKVNKLPAKFQTMEMVVNMKENAEAQMRTSVGNKFIDIKLPDANGNEIALSSMIGPGKYVLIDFWASWCGPCMRELPYLLPAYEKYHSKGFEIYGVSLDSDREKWLGAIKDNNMNWQHVSLLTGWENPSVKEYGVRGIPASFLIGPDGTIVAKDLRGKAVEEKLAELLGE